MTAPVADASVYSNPGGLASLKVDARTQSPEAVRKVAQQFESIFAKMVLSSMRQASSTVGDSMFGSDQQQFYQGMFDDQLSVELTKGKGLGLADMLVQQLTRSGLVKGGASTSAATAGTADTAGASGAQGAAPSTADIAGKKGAFALGASRSAETMGAYPIKATGGAQSSSSADANPVSSTLLGTTDASAIDATANFIKKMLAGNADAADSKDWQSGSPEDFVRALMPCAEEAGKQLGVDPRHLIAQAALETGWGKSLPCDTDGSTSNNFFGIKASGDWQGDSVAVKTLEFKGGVPVPQQAKFRSYDSPVESFRDYVEVLRNNPRYAAALNTGSDTKAFASALQRGGYATDPAYAQKITAIAQNLPINETALKSSSDAPMNQPIDVF